MCRRKAPLGWRAWHAHAKTDAHYTNENRADAKTEESRCFATDDLVQMGCSLKSFSDLLPL